MSIKAKYAKILAEIKSYGRYGRLSSSSTIYLVKASEIIQGLLDTRLDDGVELKRQCDYIFVGAMILAMASTDSYNTCTGQNKEHLYPIDINQVMEGSINNSLNGLDCFKHGFEFIGRRALENKDLQFKGSFNPACFPDLDSAFEPGHFDEYQLNVDPSVIVNPTTTRKDQFEIQKQENLRSELIRLEENLRSQLGDAARRCQDQTPFMELIDEISILTFNLEEKLNITEAKSTDIEQFKSNFDSIMKKPVYVSAMNAHRGSLIWRGFMDALANIEEWIRQIPKFISLTSFSMAPKDRFFSTKTARVAEDVCERVNHMSLG